MKQGLKLTIGSLVLASALIACGKKGGGSPAAAPTASATSGCTLDSSGVCVGVTGGYLGVGQGKAKINVKNIEKFRKFLLDNGMCQGPMNIMVVDPRFRRPGLPCTAASNYFEVQIQSVDNELLPKPVNFDVRARIGGYSVDLAGRRMTQADIYGLSNGYQVIFNRAGSSGQIPPYYYRPGYPVPVQTAAPANTNLTVVLTNPDATRTIYTAVVSYEGVVIGDGSFRGAFDIGQLAYSTTGSAPATLPVPYGRNDYPYGYSSVK